MSITVNVVDHIGKFRIPEIGIQIDPGIYLFDLSTTTHIYIGRKIAIGINRFGRYFSGTGFNNTVICDRIAGLIDVDSLVDKNIFQEIITVMRNIK